MPFANVNNCRLYYETFGQINRHQVPIVLIHGSTQTGYSCWRQVAPLLAERFLVIVPDCRGHGQSSNPEMSYSFKEMAADTAGLIKNLDFKRAHVIGHSNGGNVALVTLMEHAESVQSAILQAANAYVSPDLVEKEPAVFDPMRVAREAPGWMEEMVRLHGPTHGDNYWQQLLALTVDEIIREPNYGPEDLKKVNRPVLVIQGEDDRVNAPARHAQYIAQNIPFAQHWLPQNTGHNVHEEKRFEWIERVFAFLERRGDLLNEAVYRHQQEFYADDRVTLFQVGVIEKQAESSAQSLAIQGNVLTHQQSQRVEQIISGLTDKKLDNQIQALLADAGWALVGRTVSDLRRAPGMHYERISQVLLGETVQILRQQDNWAWVRLEKDGYLGWVQSAALVPGSIEHIREYQLACNARVIAELLPARLATDSISSKPERATFTGKLPFGIPVVVEETTGADSYIRLPGGTRWVVEQNGLLPSSEWLDGDETDIRQALQYIQRFIGVPYLWGGRTPFGFDCSGLAQTFLDFIGINVPRDADQQFRVGMPVEEPPLPGDLLFFGEQEGHESQRYAHISHVAISLGENEIIHANGAAWGVSYNSFGPNSPNYRPWLKENLVGMRRYR
jgi:pimeloyl-ACP methyl ester carboxylesterase